MQCLVVGHVFGQVPGLVLVHIGVHLVGQQHDFAGGLAVFAGLEMGGQCVRGTADFSQQCAALGTEVAGQLAVKALGQKACGAGGDVDELADQIAVHPQHEVFGVEVDVFIAR